MGQRAPRRLPWDGCDRYALVVFESLDVKSMLVFDIGHLAGVGCALGKRHPGQDQMLALTQTNNRALLADPGHFAPLGVQVLEFGDQVQ